MPQQYNGASSTIYVPTDSTYREVTIGDTTIKISYLGPTKFKTVSSWDQPLAIGPPEALEDWKNDLYSSIRRLNDVSYPIGQLTNYLPTGTVVNIHEGINGMLPRKVELPEDIKDLDGIVLATGLWLGRSLGLSLDDIKSTISQYLVDNDTLKRIIDPVASNK